MIKVILEGKILLDTDDNIANIETIINFLKIFANFGVNTRITIEEMEE